MANKGHLIVGNWKMNFTTHEASLQLHKLAGLIEARRDTEVVVAPSLLSLQPLSLQVDNRKIKLAAQNFYWRDEGAFTGEISAHQLRGLVKYALVGHSERRNIFGEQDKDIRNKVQAALRNNISPILCVGETAAERANGETHDVIHDQITGGLSNVTSEEIDRLVVAYEPIWAIGTGDNVVPTDASQVARAIRSQVSHLFGRSAAERLRILYGGSVTTDNANAYLDLLDINGLLIGGASLDARVFSTIINNAHQQK